MPVRSEKRFKSLIENAFDAISLVNATGELIYVSPSAERMTGFSLAGRTEHNGLFFVHPDDQEKSREIFQHTMEHPGTSIPFQFRIMHADGHAIWVEGVVTNHLADQDIAAVVFNYRDITERKRHEQELEESTRIVHNILESINDGFYSCDQNWIIRYWNQSAEVLFGTKREDALGKYLWDFFPGSTELKAYRELHHTMETGEKRMFEEFYGDTWFSVNTYPAKDGISVFFRDITETKRQESLHILEKEVLELHTRKNKSLEETIELLLNGIRKIHPDMQCSVLRVVGDSLYTWSSPHLPVGYNELVDGIKIRVGAGSCGTAVALKQNVIVTDIATNEYWADYREIANQFDLRACWSHLIQDDHDNVLGTFAVYYKNERSPKPAELQTIERARLILKGIIESKLAEDRILQLNADLEKRVALRTEQLQVANKELEAFAYSISHDLRAPLRSINGYTTILKEDYVDKFDEEGRKVIDTILNNTIRMGQLIDDLLNFSRTGRVAMTSEKVNMNDLIAEVIGDLKEGGVAIPDKLVIEKLDPAECDANLIRQVWTNLISNAIKYSGKNPEPRVVIGMTDSPHGRTYFVKDNGAGFDMQYADKLFNVFARLHAQHEFPGTGVGLAIAKRIVARHNGVIWAEGKPDHGATFYFVLNVQN